MNARTAFEYGLASTLLGACLVPAAVVAVPAANDVAFVLYTSPVPPLAQLLPTGFIAAIQMLAALGVAGGVRSIVAARRHDRPLALGAVGTLLNTIAFVAWLLVAVWLYGFYVEWWN